MTNTQDREQPQKGDSQPLLHRALAIFRRRYGLRETDHIDRKVGRSLRVRGLLGTAKFCMVVLFNPSHRHNKIHGSGKSPSDFDLSLGVETSEWLDVKDLDIEEHLRTNTVGYQPTPPELVREAIDFLKVRHNEFAFVDIGCGKGLTLLVASEYPFQRIIGVEHSPMLGRTARENVDRLRELKQSSPEIEIVLSDAREYQLPNVPLVVFMYNPFTGDLMKRMADNLAAEYKAHPRDIYVIYVAAVEKRFFRSFSLLKDSFLMIPSSSSGFDYRIYKV